MKTPETNQKSAGKKAAKQDKKITANGHQVQLTNLQKIYWPADKITKGELIDYYRRISKYMLPYLKNRPQSLNRHPNGIKGFSFYQKDMDVAQLPDWVRTEKQYSKSNKEYLDYLICDDKATLLYMANLGCIEINPWHSTVDDPDHPDYMMLDLDPGKIDFIHVVDTALVIKEVCDTIGMKCFCKTSGATGLHVYFPLGKKYGYDEVKLFGELFATVVNKRLPDTTTMERTISKRGEKIYLDYLQNRKGQTIVAPYSVRPKPHATVSAPLLWEEVKHGLTPQQFTIYNIEERISRVGDLWKGVLGRPIALPKVLPKLSKLLEELQL
jgi:bifunctional non-homologous end joining protein LigD